MRLLYILQPSVYIPTEIGNKWSLADSNVNMTAGFFRNLLRLDPTIQITFVVPHSLQYDGEHNDYFYTSPIIREIFSQANEVFLSGRINFEEIDSLVHPMYYRYEFNTTNWTRILLQYTPDVIINNIPEISRNIKTILVFEKLKAKLISQCFFLDCPMIGEDKVPRSISLDFRQLDGFECSDLVTFTCESTRNAFFSNAVKRYEGFAGYNKLTLLDSIFQKSTIWDFGFDRREFDIAQMRKMFRNKKILFLNRFSDYTHYKDFVTACELLRNYRADFDVYFTNPSQRDKPSYSKFFHYPDKPLSRQEYIKLVLDGDISVHLFVKERYGGCALRESIYCHNVPVVANCHEQRKIVDDLRLLVECDTIKDRINVDSLVEKLNNALNIVDNITEVDKVLQPFFMRNYKSCEFRGTTQKALKEINELCSR